MKGLYVVALALALLLCASLVQGASVKLPGIFSSNMLLQRDSPNTVWGWTTPNTPVTVNFDKKDYTVTANADGVFAVKVPSDEESPLHVGAGGGAVGRAPSKVN